MIKLFTLILPVLITVLSFKFSGYKFKKMLKRDCSTLKDPLLITIVNRLCKPLEINNFKILIYQSSSVNGLASPDGRILLTQGFLNAYYQGQVTAEEIAGVVAHELGHVALNHSGRRTISFGIQSTIRYTFGILVSRFIPFIGNQVMELVLRTLNAKLSRVDEYAADKYAAALLTKTGIGTEPLITLFEKLDKLSGTQNQGIAWLASHPNSKDRIKQINQLTKDWHQ